MNIVKCASLYYSDASSDKEYHAQIQDLGNGQYNVTFQYGRRGGALKDGIKNSSPLTIDDATKAYDKLIKEKTSKGYTDAGGAQLSVIVNKVDSGYLPQLLNPIEEDEVPTYVNDDNWIAQEKFDGHRRMMELDSSNSITSINRKGERVGLPLETEQELRKIKVDSWVIDGEMIGNSYFIFDILILNGVDLRSLNVVERFNKLKTLLKSFKSKLVMLCKTAFTKQEKEELIRQVRDEGGEGVVFKKVDSQYVAGRPNSYGNQLKFKLWKSATFQVIGINQQRSVEIGLYSNNQLKSLGNVTIPANHDIPKINDLVEVRYLYAFKNGNVYQPVYLGLRDDLSVDACNVAQLCYKKED